MQQKRFFSSLMEGALFILLGLVKPSVYFEKGERTPTLEFG